LGLATLAALSVNGGGAYTLAALSVNGDGASLRSA
jgi:hypothetical protein